MGATQSNNQISNVNNKYTEKGYEVFDKNGLEIINIDFNFENTETDSISEMFNKIDSVTRNAELKNEESATTSINSDSSPFVSPDVYNKIMNERSSDFSSNSPIQNKVSSPFINSEIYNKILDGGNKDNTSSPFMSTDGYNKMMNGGHRKRDFDDSSSSESNDSDDSTSDSEILNGLSSISISMSSDPKYYSNVKKGNKPKKNKDKYSTTSEILVNDKNSNYSNTSIFSSGNKQKLYGFSHTSSEIIKTSEDNYYLNNEVSSDTPYKIDSSSINTSDVNLISVDSRNGRRFI